jgi:hypothetical protein
MSVFPAFPSSSVARELGPVTPPHMELLSVLRLRKQTYPSFAFVVERAQPDNPSSVSRSIAPDIRHQLWISRDGDVQLVVIVVGEHSCWNKESDDTRC